MTEPKPTEPSAPSGASEPAEANAPATPATAPAARLTPGGPPKPIRPRALLRKVLRGLGLAAAAALVSCALALLWLWPRCEGDDCPSAEKLAGFVPPQATVVLDRDGHALAQLGSERRIVVPLASLPPHVWGAFVAVEDQRFFAHHGVDWRRAAGALLADLRALRAREGFSTITMQLVRNVFPSRITRARTLRRKVWEVVLALQVEERLPKQRILELYLNQIYLGEGLWGLEAASRAWFGKPAAQLTPAQAALLAALAKGPSIYDPRRFPAAAVERRNLVLQLMERTGVITKEEAAKARREKVKLLPPEQGSAAPWFVAQVRRALVARFGADVAGAGYVVRTTLDAGLQAAAVKSLAGQLSAIEAGRLGRFLGERCEPKDGDPEECLQGMVAAVDARDGAVRALVGGRDFALSQYDRAAQAHRQPGSAFKPVVWAAALELGIPLTTVLGGGEPAGFQPAEHAAELHGPLTLREALRVSSNRAAVDLGQRAGVGSVQLLAGALGLSTPVPALPSSFLGAGEVVPLELVTAYAPFLNGGSRVAARFIDEVRDLHGALLWQAEPLQTPVLTPGTAFLMSSLLGEVLAHGTGASAMPWLPAGLAAGGKTGTTNDGQDCWFVGGTPELVAGVWIGFDRPHPIVRGATGGRLAAPVWGRLVGAAYKLRVHPAPWTPPPGVEEREVDVLTGGLATSGCPRGQVVREWFLPRTAPAEECTVHQGGLGGFFKGLFGD